MGGSDEYVISVALLWSVIGLFIYRVLRRGGSANGLCQLASD
jgi:hypothetical protein